MAKNSDKDKRMAAELKRNHVERTTGRCPVCYRIVTSENLNAGTRNKHIGNCFK